MMKQATLTIVIVDSVKGLPIVRLDVNTFGKVIVGIRIQEVRGRKTPRNLKITMNANLVNGFLLPCILRH